jgi:1-deoxy-D-xylulose-5-phosphate reductoisomerase
MKKKVAVLGATGSIGKNTLDILRNQKDYFEPVLFSSNKSSMELLKLKKEFPGALTAMASNSAEGIDFLGKDGLLQAIAAAGADITVNGIAGAAGLEPSLAAINAGSDLALANKETIVMAGHLVQALCKKKNVNIIPVDSEHSALFKLLEGHGRNNASEIILTASGGPFRNYTYEELLHIKPREALAHPTWSMGPKITVDSASMANKGLEVIEAAGLFGFTPDKIKVTIHPQSIVHSMIRLNNGVIYAQISKPDMRLPIHDALWWPKTEVSSYGSLDFDSLSLSFERCDPERFPMLALAYESLRGTAFLPAVYNAANEIAVEAFLKERIGFLEIPRIVGYVINQSKPEENPKPGEEEINEIETVLAQDRKARKLAVEYIENRRS